MLSFKKVINYNYDKKIAIVGTIFFCELKLCEKQIFFKIMIVFQ